MQSIAIVVATALGLFASVLAAPTPAPDGVQAEAAACERTCDDIESSTDRQTCKLQCRQKAESGPQVIRWKQTRLLGGSPEGGKNAGGTTTTVTTSDKQGAASTTTTVHTYGEDATPGAPVSTTHTTVKADPYAVLAACQAACNPIAEAGTRASCKLQCLYPSKMRATATTMTASSPAKPATAPAGTKAAVGPGAAPGTPAAKATPASKPAPAPAAKPVADPAVAAQCRSACATKQSTCRESCTGSGSDAATCRLQCDGAADRCRARC